MDVVPVVNVRSASDTRRQRDPDWVLVVGSILMGAVNYGYSLVMVHLLAPTEFAIFGFVSSLLLIMGSFSGAALPYVLARQVANTQSGTPARGQAVAFALSASTAASIAASLIVVLLSIRFASPLLALFSVASCIAVFLGAAVNGYLQGEHRFAFLAGIRLLEVVAKLVLGTLFVLVMPSAELAIAGFASGSMIVTLLGFWVIRHDLRRWSFASATDRVMWSDSLRLGAMQALVSLAQSIDVIVLGLVLGNTVEFAQYQAVLILARIPLFLSFALSTTAFIRLASSRTPPSEEPGVISRSLAKFFLIAGLSVAGIATAPDFYLGIVLPDAYLEAQPLLLPLAIAGMAAGLVTLSSFYTRAVQRYRAMAFLIGGSTVVTALLLSAVAQSITVAAWLMAPAMVLMSVGALLIVWRFWRQISLPWAPLAALAAATALLLLARPFPLAWTIGAAVVGITVIWWIYRVANPR